jgi:hypothetical protein
MGFWEDGLEWTKKINPFGGDFNPGEAIKDTAEAAGGIAGDRGDNEFRNVDASKFGLPGYDSAMRQRQRLINMLDAQARGAGPSTADMQMQRGLQGALAQQNALAQSARGNPALAHRQAAINSGNAASQITSQGTLNRLLEQRQGQDQLQKALAGQLDVQKAGQLGRLESERARTQRFGSLTGVPTSGEAGLGMLSSLLGFLGSR